MNIINLSGIVSIQRLVPPLVAGAMADPTAYAPTAEPVRKRVGVMISPGTTLRGGHSTELGCPQNDGVLEQPALLQVANQR